MLLRQALLTKNLFMIEIMNRFLVVVVPRNEQACCQLYSVPRVYDAVYRAALSGLTLFL